MKNLIVFLLLITSHPAYPAKKLISKSVAMVQGHVLTSREVLISYYVERALFSKKKIKRLKLKSGTYKKHINANLLEWVVYRESQSFNATEVEEAELDKAFRTTVSKVGKLAYWLKLKVSVAELKKFIERKLRAKILVKFKIETSMVNITDAEALTYYEEKRSRFGGVEFEKVKLNIKKYLSNKQMQLRLKNWFELLQSKYKSQVL